MKQLLLEILRARLSAGQWSWLENAVASTATPGTTDVLANYTAASRKLGKYALQLGPLEKRRLAEHDRRLNIDHWGADEAARAVILLSLAELSSDRYTTLAQQCYELGDSREQQSWLRSLSVLPRGGLFLHTAIDSCRTNIIPLFEAIACENPYPSIYFPELNFNQLVLKCLFNRIAVARIVGLESRLNPELSRMADHYASELKAAGRDVPKDIHLTDERSECKPDRAQPSIE